MAIDEVSEFLYEEDMEDAMENMLEKIEERHSDKCDNVTVIALAWDDRSAPGKSMQHEQIRELKDNDLWRAARDAEKEIRNNNRARGSMLKGSTLDGTASEENLDSVISEVESFVKRWEEGK
jgi:hypothetical protein